MIERDKAAVEAGKAPQAPRVLALGAADRENAAVTESDGGALVGRRASLVSERVPSGGKEFTLEGKVLGSEAGVITVKRGEVVIGMEVDLTFKALLFSSCTFVLSEATEGITDSRTRGIRKDLSVDTEDLTGSLISDECKFLRKPGWKCDELTFS